MARTWLAIRVELLGTRGEQLWPPPGRVLVVGPAHTFADLAKAIDDGFARWDRGHLCEFTLADGTVITDEESADEAGSISFGPVPKAALLLDKTKVCDTIKPGDEFMYVFDFGDGWTHACRVDDAKVDPRERVGITPKQPTAIWGWGSIPDQYGRLSDDEGDDDDEPVPPSPSRPHPMLQGGWPSAGPADPVDLRELRGATYTRDVPAILAAIEGHEIDDLLQHVGMAVQVVLAGDRGRGESLAFSVLNRLEERGLPGDDVLAEDLLAQLRNSPVEGRHLRVDLSSVASEMAGDPGESEGLLDLRTGEVVPGMLVDPMYVSEQDDGFIDVDEEPDRWLRIERAGSRAGWEDMAAFATALPVASLRERLEAAIEGKGAFRRFRDAIGREGLISEWQRFSEDREVGRARAWLAAEGIRVLPGG
jgi:hypothetical protein